MTGGDAPAGRRMSGSMAKAAGPLAAPRDPAGPGSGAAPALAPGETGSAGPAGNGPAGKKGIKKPSFQRVLLFHTSSNRTPAKTEKPGRVRRLW